MFGFLRPQVQNDSYRQLYARLCQHYRMSFGIRSILCLNYETLLLYAMAVDIGHFSKTDIKAQRCCRLKRDPAMSHAADWQLGEFLAASGLVAGWVKIDDDRRDGHPLRSKAIGVVLRGPIRRARTYFSVLDEGFEAHLRDVLSWQASLEAGTTATWDEFCQPSTAAFQKLFALFARVINIGDGVIPEPLPGHIARAMVLFDQAADYERDQRTRSFSLLHSDADRAAAFDRVGRELAAAEALCTAWLGPDAATVAILKGVRIRVAAYAASKAEPQAAWRTAWAGGYARAFLAAVGVLVMPTSAFAGSGDDDRGCLCFCIGYACGEASAQGRK